MINEQDLGERIIKMFNFMYESKDYYVSGRDYFRPCTDLEFDVYQGSTEALERRDKDWFIEQIG